MERRTGDQFRSLRREGKGDAPRIFLRLLHRPTYAYDLAKEIYGERGHLASWAGKLSGLLREMEEKGLLRAEEKYFSRRNGLPAERGVRRVYYRVNPEYLKALAEKGRSLLRRHPGQGWKQEELGAAAAWVLDAVAMLSLPPEKINGRIDSLFGDPSMVPGYFRDLAEELRIGIDYYREVRKTRERLEEVRREKKEEERSSRERLEERLRTSRKRIRELERGIAKVNKGSEPSASGEKKKLEREIRWEKEMMETVKAYQRGERTGREVMAIIAGYYERKTRAIEEEIKNETARLERAERRLAEYAGECRETGYLDIAKLGEIWPGEGGRELAGAITRLAACLNTYLLASAYSERGLLPRHLEKRLVARLGLTE